MDFSLVTEFQKNIASEALKKDIKYFLLATSDFGEEIQRQIDLYVTQDRLNEASFRKKLDLILKNIIRNHNLLKILSYFLKTFRLSMHKIL